ncbi:YaaC family protein [Brevibacillus sp. TJ4]|uniref:YaaC family protein n=1 Tax=Brevibacillus sp. TJ4 TaxID=3234853 RepID=UPI0037CDE6D0
MDNSWKLLQSLEAEPIAKHYLSRCYKNKGFSHPERLAFQQSSRFSYLWRQARLFYLTAETADLSVQPLLLFYGCAHLLKAMLITQEPSYPQNSKVLQHGVTTRKVKKSSYQLTEDEVRPQKEGLFPLLARSFALHPMQDRYLVHELFLSIAPLSRIYASVTDTKPVWIPVAAAPFIRQDEEHNGSSWACLTFPETADGPLAYSPETLLQYIRRFSSSEPVLSEWQWRTGESDKQLLLPQCALSRLEQHPFFDREGDTLYFWNDPTDTPPLPAWASHYLLLYVLGMLCRYETEWWGELTMSHGLAERYLVERFLDYHVTAFPAALKMQIERSTGVSILT